jgi:small subunit ribosomal protein S17
MTTDKKTERNRRRGFQGIVVSDKTDKTRVVNVQRLVRHPRYEKIVRRRSKFYVHDEDNLSHVGDQVEIVSTRPMSKLKRWRLVRVVKVAEKVDMGKPAGKKEA